MAYFLLAIPFLAIVILLDTVILKTWVVSERRTWLILAGLLLATLLFDSFLVQYIVEYDRAKVLLHIGRVPIEDLGYTIAVVIGMGTLVRYETRKR